MQKISLSNKNNRLSTKTKVILIILIIIIAAVGASVFIFLKTYHVYETKVIQPTCETMGYTESTCIYCGDIKRTLYTEALGHDYGELTVKSKPSELTFGEKIQTCSRCAVEKITKTEPTSDMKKFYFSGDAFTTTNRVATGSMTYSYNDKSTSYYIKLRYIDSSNVKYVKHDYRISFFEDKDLTTETEVSLMDGVEASDTWEIYGNYYDYLNLRDVVTTELFKQVRSSSEKYNKNLGDNYLTRKSEPVLVFINESFAGVFRLFEPYGADIMNVSDDEEMCAIVTANGNNQQSYFRQETTENGTWQIKYNYSEETDWIYDSLNELVKFINENDGDDFKKGIGKHLDIDGMIDYMLTVYNTAAANNVGRAFTLGTYDGKVWTPGMADINESLGMNDEGEISKLEDILVPAIEEDEFVSDTGSLLWDKMLENFYDEIKTRYNELKGEVFTAENIYKKFESHMKEVPESVYEKEKDLYEGVDTETDLKQALTEFMATRKNIFEVFFED